MGFMEFMAISLSILDFDWVKESDVSTTVWGGMAVSTNLNHQNATIITAFVHSSLRI